MRTGYLVLPQLFTATEVGRLRDAAEQVHAEVVAAAESGETEVTIWPDGHRLEEIRGTTIHWEPDAPGKAVRSLAPVSHLQSVLTELWTERLVDLP
jgi:ectoine hydroxylase